MSNKKSNLKLNKNPISNFQSLAYVSRKSHGFGSKKLDGIGVRFGFKSYQAKEKGIFSFLFWAEGLCLTSTTHSLKVGI